MTDEAAKLQQLLREQYEAMHRESSGHIGYTTWNAFGRPDGWLVWTNGSWWPAEELNSISEEVDGQQ